MKTLTHFVGLPVTAGASTPTGVAGATLWSTIENDWLYWNGSNWINADSGGGASGPTLGVAWMIAQGRVI